ncbi:MAG: GNAT family N-acetyltransferase [Alphaproteobacteria bacterium]
MSEPSDKTPRSPADEPPGKLRQSYTEGFSHQSVVEKRTDIQGRILAEAKSLQVRLALDENEIRASQALRYRVFYEEMSAKPTPDMAALLRDYDAYDDYTDHLLVIDTTRTGDEAVVGSYRLLRQEVADRHSGFYSVSEFDIAPMLEGALGPRHSRDTQFLELGRSCVAKEYRSNSTIQLLWRGITAYVLHHRIGLMFGCASLEGTDPDKLALPLSFLHHNFGGEPPFYVRALPDQYVEMNRMAKDDIDMKAALKTLPPLVKGYLRLGCFIGDGAVVDEQFGTTDVCIILPVERISDRYVKRFEKDANAAIKE